MGHDITFLLGDLNYRIEGGKVDIQAMVAARDWAALQSRDQVTRTRTRCAAASPSRALQLLQQMSLRPDVFQHFREAPLLFAPSYKYDPGTLVYDTSSKARAPAWCDRVLFACASPGLRLQCAEYSRLDVLWRSERRRLLRWRLHAFPPAHLTLSPASTLRAPQRPHACVCRVQLPRCPRRHAVSLAG
jgi:hypothetical protein